MYRKFINARSPLRLLEKGLHGGLGKGNIGVLLAGHGVGKTACLVGIALDDLLRGGHVLHVALDHGVGHVRTFYDTVFEDFASSTQLEDVAVVHAELDRCRSIRAYPTNAFSVSKLREAAKLESEAGSAPELIVIDHFDFEAATRDEVENLRALARELDAEIWMSAAEGGTQDAVPAAVEAVSDAISVILRLQPVDDAVALRALKDHDSPDVSALHVHLDPKTLLLQRG